MDGARFRVATAVGDTIYDSGEADGNANGNTNGDAGGNTNGNTNGDTGGNTNGNTNENADGIDGGNSNGNADGNANGNAVGLLGEAEEAGEAGEAGEAAGGLPLKELAAAGAGTVAIDGADYYKKSIVDGTYGYAAYYYLPQSVIDSQSQTAAIPIFLLVLGFSIVSAAIYRITLQVSGRRISQIEAGMREIGRRNFEYRMPVGRQNDELTLVASGFNSMCDQLQDTIDKVYLYNIRQREASLYALQTSINPHFLYNTLEAVRSKLEEDGSLEASEMIVMLSRIFEYQAKGDSYVTIGQELEALEMYVQFFSMRYDNRFAFRLDVQGDVGECMMPKYTLQPIMEYYFIHGIRRGGDNHIAVTVCRSEGEIRIEAEDDGMGIAPAELASLRDRLARLQDSKKSLGLINVHQRLRYTYGAPYGIERIESGGGGEGDGDANGAGTRIVLRIRALRAEEIGRAALPAQGGG
jgi:HAMP domain-containing protein